MRHFFHDFFSQFLLALSPKLSISPLVLFLSQITFSKFCIISSLSSAPSSVLLTTSIVHRDLIYTCFPLFCLLLPTWQTQEYLLPLQQPHQWHCHHQLSHASPYPFPTICLSLHRKNAFNLPMSNSSLSLALLIILFPRTLAIEN